MNEKKEREEEDEKYRKKKKVWFYSKEYIVLEWFLEAIAIQQRHDHSSRGQREEQTL